MKHIAVIGSGTMGNGIAQVFAQYDYTVSLIDINQNALDKAIATITANLDRMIAKQTLTEEVKVAALKNITTYTELSKGVANADLAIEAVSERIDIKLKVFEDLDKHCKPECILASNTSSISISMIGAATQRGDKVIGMHFMNPVPMMKLVEVIRGYLTSNSVAAAINELSVRIGKIPTEVNDYPGFISNRVLIPMINEAIFALHERVSNVRDIDTVMKFGMNHPMGPLQLADFIGLDVVLNILYVLYDGFKNPKYAPCPLLVNMVRAGHLGKKSGHGFYQYKEGSKDLIVADAFRRW